MLIYISLPVLHVIYLIYYLLFAENVIYYLISFLDHDIQPIVSATDMFFDYIAHVRTDFFTNFILQDLFALNLIYIKALYSDLFDPHLLKLKNEFTSHPGSCRQK